MKWMFFDVCSYVWLYNIHHTFIKYIVLLLFDNNNIDRSKKGANGKNVEKWENKSCIVRIVYDVL